MFKSRIGHLVFMISKETTGFYKELFQFMGWTVLMDAEIGVGFGGDDDTSIWFMVPAKPVANDYDGPGLNHLALSVRSQSDVDQAARFLSERGVVPLFETPRHRPDFVGSPDQTYFQVMFESPDRILFEIVYMGPKG